MSLLASNWLPTTSYRVVDPIENLRLQVTPPQARHAGRAQAGRRRRSRCRRGGGRGPRARTTTTRRPRTTTRRRSAPRRRRRRRSSRRRRSGGRRRCSGRARRARCGGRRRRQPRERRAPAAARPEGEGFRAPTSASSRRGSTARRRRRGEWPPRGVGAAHADLVGVCRRRHVVDRAVHDERAREGDAARALRPLGADGGQHRDALGEPAAISMMPTPSSLPTTSAPRASARARRSRRARARAAAAAATARRACSCCCARCGPPAPAASTCGRGSRPTMAMMKAPDVRCTRWRTRYEWRLRTSSRLSSEQQAAEVAAERALRLQAAMAHARAPSQLDFGRRCRRGAPAPPLRRARRRQGLRPHPALHRVPRVGRARLAPLTGGLPARAITQVAAPRGASGRAVLGF